MNHASERTAFENIAICIPTCQRPNMLRACLLETGKITCPDGFKINVIVADNDASGSASKVCDDLVLPFPLHYVIEPERGLASVRNRLLKEAILLDANWIAFIDDDEMPDPQWLLNFAIGITRYSPDVLTGPLVQFNEG